MYYITDYYTDEIIDVVPDVEDAIRISRSVPDSQVETEDDEVLYTNIDIPF